MSKAEIQRKVLKLRLFGTAQFFLGETPLPPLRSRKGEWLLALLALRGAAVSRSWLSGTLWPDSEESRALLYLRRELMYLRKALGAEFDTVVVAGRTVQLNLAAVDCDLLAFDAAIARGDESSLEAAVSLYGGTLLEGCDEEWVMQEREARKQACLVAVERLAGLAEARGDSATAIRCLRSVVTLDPLRESAQRALMRILTDTGDSAAAIQVYRDLRLHLRRALNTEVDSETRALFLQIRDRTSRRSPTATRAPRKDDETRITRIPVPLTRLIGREQELQEIRWRLGRTRLLTLAGTGGVGKTRLSIEVAEEMRDDFADGVCFVELASLLDPSLVSQAVLDAFGWESEARRTAVETLANRLRSSELLLVLDNCEHLIQPCAELAGSLLATCPHLRILTTSREPLGIAGESIWRVPSLSTPPATDNSERKYKDFVQEMMAYEAVALFVERGQQARPDFMLTPLNGEAVSRICQQLDGIPLAIELAAARVRSLTVEDVDRKLDERFRLLTGGSRNALPRHQTLRSLVEWSYDLLNEPEKALLCRLSVFVGGWTLEAAEQVCAGSPVEQGEILDLLTSLSDKSLVVADTFGPSVRYRLLETMRQYARYRLADSDNPEHWRERHLAYFLARAEEAEPELMGAEQDWWFERLTIDHDNLRAALEWSLESASEPESGLRFCAALWWFWRVRGHSTEGRQWCERALRRTEARSPSKAWAGALHGAGALARLQGDYSAAHAFFAESLVLRREIGDRKGIAFALHGLGFVTSDQGDYTAARAFLEESLDLHRANGDAWGIPLVLNRLGFIAHEQGDYETAHSLYEESLTLRREAGDQWGIANSLNNLGAVAYDSGDYAASRAFGEESLMVQREIDDRTGILLSLINLAMVACKEGDVSGARVALTEATAISRITNDRKRAADVLETWGGLAVVEEQWARAATLLGASESLRESIGSPLPPNERPAYDAQIAVIRAALRSDDAFDSASAQGRALTLEQAIEFALNGLGTDIPS